MLRLKFKIAVNDNADDYLGVHFESLTDGSLKLSQPKLLQQLFSKYSDVISNNRFASTPTKPKQQHNSTTLTTRKTPLQSCAIALLGSLMYSTRSRPDTLSTVSFAATHSQHPTEDNYNYLLHLVVYLFHSPKKGLILRLLEDDQPLQLRCYVDAAYLVHDDSKSHIGYALTFGELGTFYLKSLKPS